jgi:alkylation response protein AidB-like acyl-CoA dehydrogenase
MVSFPVLSELERVVNYPVHKFLATFQLQMLGHGTSEVQLEVINLSVLQLSKQQITLIAL